MEGVAVEPADLDADDAPAGLVRGYIGPQGLSADVRYVVDPLVVMGSEWVTGANRHIFQLGRKYTDAFRLDVLGSDGKPRRVRMGSYGIGVSRAVAAIAEQTHDDKGLLWPGSVAPADVHVVAVGKDDQMQVATRLAVELEAAGRRVLFDDRSASPGVAFKDAELLGVPTILVVGKGLIRGVVEVRDRRAGTVSELPVGEVVAALIAT